jgi:hypothetical protein
VGSYSRAIASGTFATAKGIATTRDDWVCWAIIERLMCDLEVDLAAVTGACGRDAEQRRIDLDQAPAAAFGYFFTMSQERATDLARLCTEVLRNGDEFPPIWQTLLKGHPLVEGIPRQKLDGNRSLLEITLIAGERLVYDGAAR